MPGPKVSKPMDERLRSWILDFVGAASEAPAVDGWVNHVLGRIVGEVDEVRDDAALQSVVKSACDAHWRAFLANLGQPEQTFHLVHEARDVPLVLAQHGYALPVIFEIYTAGEQAVWEFITSEVKKTELPGVSEADALVHFWTRSSTWFDRSVERSVTIYQEEVERIRQGDAARRLEVVREILSGSLTDPREASARLGGHPISGYQTAVVLHTAEDAVISELPQATARMAGTLGLRNPLIVHPGGRDLWAWFASADLPDLTRLQEATGWLAEREIVATVGSPGSGLDGFASSHHEALVSQKISLRNARPAPITYFADVELMALIGDGADMRRFVHRVLGRLTSTDDQVARLRMTVQALLATGNVEAAAQRLTVHKNTVRYRIERAEELMGRRLAEASTEIEVALRCHETFFSS